MGWWEEHFNNVGKMLENYDWEYYDKWCAMMEAQIREHEQIQEELIVVDSKTWTG